MLKVILKAKLQGGMPTLQMRNWARRWHHNTQAHSETSGNVAVLLVFAFSSFSLSHTGLPPILSWHGLGRHLESPAGMPTQHQQPLVLTLVSHDLS